MRGDVARALLAFALLVAALTFIGSRIAHADRPVNGWWPRGAVAFIGLDDDLPDAIGSDSGVPFCHDNNHHTGVFGARIPAYRWDDQHTVVLNLEHNSCLEEESDLASDDRIGIRYEYRAW